MKALFTKTSKKILSLAFGIILMTLLLTIEVSAAGLSESTEADVKDLPMLILEGEFEEKEHSISTKALLYNCLINVYSSSSGMEVSFVTDCVQVASSIGVKDIVIKQRVWYGWKTVATSSGAQRTNSTTFMGEILYTNAIKGETYRISCTHYADADEYTEVENELDVVFTY